MESPRESTRVVTVFDATHVKKSDERMRLKRQTRGSRVTVRNEEARYHWSIRVKTHVCFHGLLGSPDKKMN